MASSPSIGTKIFISYSHADKTWLERLKRHLKPLVREGSLDYWDDTHIRTGDDWQQEIRIALDRAQVAVLLISADFFASEFINKAELPHLLAAAQAKGVRVLPVIVSACRFERESLAQFQAVNSPDQPLDGMPPAEQEKVLDRLAQTIESATLAAELESVKDEVKQQGSDIEVIRFMITAMLPIWELTILSKIDASAQYMVNTDTEWDTFWRDLGDLLGRGFIKQIQPGTHLQRGGLQNVKRYYEIDDLGRQYLRLREQFLRPVKLTEQD